MPAVVREFLDEVLVGVAQLVVGNGGVVKLVLGVVLDEVGQRLVTQAVLVGPGSVAEDAVQRVRVGLLNDAHRLLQRHADIDGRLPHIAPMGALGDLEAVVLCEAGILPVAVAFFQRGLKLLVVDIADALVEEQREDVLLVVAGVDGAA